MESFFFISMMMTKGKLLSFEYIEVLEKMKGYHR